MIGHRCCVCTCALPFFRPCDICGYAEHLRPLRIQPLTIGPVVAVVRIPERSDRVMETIDRCVAERIEAAIAKERADLRSWLGQQAAKANKAGDKISGAAFKAAADHLKPRRIKAGLAKKKAERAGK